MNHKFITLEELMKRVRAELLAELVGAMGMLAMMGLEAKDTGRKMSFKSRDLLEKIANIEERCHDSGLEVSAISARRIVNLLKGYDVIKDEKLRELTEEADKLHTKLLDEMSLVTYFTVEKDKQKYLVGNPFGELVTDAFPSAIVDIEEAGKCLAFERWTAAVFHLSRVAEIAIVKISERVGYASPKPGFGEALRYMDSNLDKARKDYEHANPLFKGDIEFLSTVTTQMHAVNEAWRQRVSHLDKKYTEEEAVRIWDTTKVLLQQLATKLKEETDV